MKDLIFQINQEFESRIRIGIMSILMVNDKVDYITLKETLAISDGNLASHIKGLEKAQYITIKKQFIGKKPNTVYSASAKGKKAFKDHLDVLEKLLKRKSQFKITAT